MTPVLALFVRVAVLRLLLDVRLPGWRKLDSVADSPEKGRVEIGM
jgi:hypothetical protein